MHSFHHPLIFFFFLMIRRPPRSTRFPCTTLFRSSTRLNSSHSQISYAVFCLPAMMGRNVGLLTSDPIIAGKLNCWVVSCNTSSVTIPVAPPPAPSGNTIYPGQALIQNTSQSTLWSSDGRFFVVMQGDGNFCLYWNGVRVLWCAPGTYHHGYEAIMQGDGNFAIYDAGGAYVWGTYNGNIRAVQPGSYITMQNDGNFVEYGSTGASWASNTCCH